MSEYEVSDTFYILSQKFSQSNYNSSLNKRANQRTHESFASSRSVSSLVSGKPRDIAKQSLSAWRRPEGTRSGYTLRVFSLTNQRAVRRKRLRPRSTFRAIRRCRKFFGAPFHLRDHFLVRGWIWPSKWFVGNILRPPSRWNIADV